MNTLLLGYDSEGIKEDFLLEQQGLSAITEVHRKHSVPATLFILGRAFLSDVAFYKNIVSLFDFDIQQHTYSHILLNDLAVCPYGGSAAPIEIVSEEIPFMRRILKKYLGVDSRGLRAPVSYLGGLRSRPDVLDILERAGLDFVSSDATDSWQQFLTGEASSNQPFLYRNGLWEVPMHSLHDGVWKDVNGYNRLDLMSAYYTEELRRFQGKIYAPVFHPWILAKDDPHAVVLDNLITHAKELQFEILNYSQIVEQLYQTHKT
tara:strand:- start:2553 stop:3338 length:786 start_codon:yes stop_codon:yes gene_type:complete